MLCKTGPTIKDSRLQAQWWARDIHGSRKGEEPAGSQGGQDLS